MGCYPSRADGVTTLAGGSEALSPTASPTAITCCAPVRGNGSTKNNHPSPGQTPTSGWVNNNDKLNTLTPGMPDPESATDETQQSTQSSLEPASPMPTNPAPQLLPGALAETSDETPNKDQGVIEAPSKYKAFVPIGGEYVPVSTAGAESPGVSDGASIDFEAEKLAIEAQFCSLEKALDEGTMERAEIERQFETLTNQAARLRRLQAATQQTEKQSPEKQHPQQEQQAPVQESKPPVKLAPVGVPAPGPPSLAPLATGSSSAPTMAVVHWKGVTKKKFVVYKDAIIEKYGDGSEGIKSIERIPNRILITVPVAEVMLRILADESLDPRPEPYKLPGGNAAPKPATTLSKPGALGVNNSLLGPPDGLAPLRSPSKLGPARVPSPFAASNPFDR